MQNVQGVVQRGDVPYKKNALCIPPGLFELNVCTVRVSLAPWASTLPPPGQYVNRIGCLTELAALIECLFFRGAPLAGQRIGQPSAR